MRISKIDAWARKNPVMTGALTTLLVVTSGLLVLIPQGLASLTAIFLLTFGGIQLGFLQSLLLKRKGSNRSH